MRGLFITIEGMDGCGKSTQLRFLAKALNDRGLNPMLTREPGGTPLGEGVRELLSSAASTSAVPAAELFLIVAARAQHVSETVLPALRNGQIVISDRYTDSTVAFQGYGRGLDLGLIETINAAATGGLRPDLTILLDLEPAQAQARMSPRPIGGWLGAVDLEKLDFHTRVRQGYLDLATREAGRIRVVEAVGTSEETHRAVMKVMNAFLSEHESVNRHVG